MKLQLLVIGCCVALAVSKPAEDACAAMRARLLPSLEPSARADAGALRACDADSDGAVDAAELVSCVQRAFGSTAHMDRAEVGERISCFRSMMEGTPFGAQQSQRIDNEQLRQDIAAGSSSGGFNGNVGLPPLDCFGQNQLGEILGAIAMGQLVNAYDALKNWYISVIAQSSGPLNGLLHSVSFLLQSLLTGRSAESLVFMVTAFVRSADNGLTLPVEDTLIMALFEVSLGKPTAAQSRIQVRLDAGVSNPAIQVELQWIVDALDSGSSEAAVVRIISLLTGLTTSLDDSTITEILGVYDQLVEQSDSASDSFNTIFSEIQSSQQCLSNALAQRLGAIAVSFVLGDSIATTRSVIAFLTASCGFDSEFVLSLATLVNDINGEGVQGILTELIADYGSESSYAGAIGFLQTALDGLSSENGAENALAEIRNILEECAGV